MLENDSLVKHGMTDFDTREIGFYLLEKRYDKAKEVLEYYIENKNKWNKRWWEEKEAEYQELYDAIENNDMNYIQRYKIGKKRKTCLIFIFFKLKSSKKLKNLTKTSWNPSCFIV